MIIITRNEEKNILECIYSVKTSLNFSKIKDYEIIVVDSNSSDLTLDLIINEDVRIIKLVQENNFFSAAMGRAIGAKVANKETLLFLDADMRLNIEWFSNSLKYLNECDGVIGEIIDVNEENHEEILRLKRYNIKKVQECSTFGGALMIKKKALIEAGNYNYNIKINEENELYSRLKMKKLKILEIPMVMAKHYTPKENIIQKIRSIIFTKYDNIRYGRALAFKYSIRNNSIIEFIVIKKEFYLSIIVDFISILSLFYGVKTFIFLQIFLLLYYSLRKHIKNYFIDKLEIIKFFIGVLSITKDNTVKYEVLK
ncbi:glycosyltransferase family 2 protein [Clostridium perfringens]|uniref:glycosyltransferase family 2 protein n=2 Tax=Clostridium perfringens TaxID=1502 RepID=UPI002ACBFB32|nr:glycosyltransferase family 2 protein [Clostridium perfringens]